ncbi:DUF2238 domain-containing protein [bacterium 210820-DFI.6.52]|nr:DUF2238 domain-containing protein [bacterium 210820-DFI.6.52]
MQPLVNQCGGRAAIAAYLAGTLAIGVVDFFCFPWPYLLVTAAAPLFLLIPPLAYRLLRLRPVPALSRAVALFAFLAYGVGIAMKGYHWFPWFDKFVHLLSGVLFALLGLCLFAYLKRNRPLAKEDAPFAFYFALSFPMLIAACWEIAEYACDFVFHTDPQRVLTTGIHDTMLDMIACLLGTLLVLWALWRFHRRRKAGPLMRAFLDFWQANAAVPAPLESRAH